MHYNKKVYSGMVRASNLIPYEFGGWDSISWHSSDGHINISGKSKHYFDGDAYYEPFSKMLIDSDGVVYIDDLVGASNRDVTVSLNGGSRIRFRTWGNYGGELYTSDVTELPENFKMELFLDKKYIPPTLTVNKNDYGVQNSGFSISYKVDVPSSEHKIPRLVIKHNGTIIKNSKVDSGNYSINLRNDNFYNVYKYNEIEMTLDDGLGNINTETITFTRDLKETTMFLQNPIESEEIPKRCIIYINGILPGRSDEWSLQVCNNAFDENPTWEDASEASRKSEIYMFNNDEKTSDKWGFNIKLNLKNPNNTTTPVSKIYSISGNFD